MSNRREFLKALTAGTAVAGLPPVQEVKTLHVTEHDAVVLRYPGRLSRKAQELLARSWETKFPGTKCIILEEGMDIEILKGSRMTDCTEPRALTNEEAL